MKITSFRVYKYALALNQPLTVHGVKLIKRDGFLIHLKSERDTEGFGEIIPLPGRSEESPHEVQEQIRELKNVLTGREVLAGVEKLDGKMRSWFSEMNLWPSVQFGIEMAVLNLVANTRHSPLFNTLTGAGHHDYTRVNALLDGTLEEVQKQAKRLREEGFTEMKLKVRGSIAESADKVRAVNEVLQGEVLLHLDANQAWELDEAVRFGREIECSSVSYIEEPLKHVYQTPEFYQETMIPVALDESLLKLSFEEFKGMDGVDVIIVKPTVLGGIEKAWQYMQQAHALGLAAVVSSSLESGVGLLTLANLAGCAARDQSAGLDTQKLFAQDLLKERPLIKNGKIDIRQPLIREEDLDLNLLHEIPL